MKNEKGFTLVEMLIVMMIISVLLILIIPNVMKQQSIVQSKGCQAFQKNVQAQVQAYMLDNDNEIPTIEQLKTEKYVETEKCPDGKSISIAEDGNVTIKDE